MARMLYILVLCAVFAVYQVQSQYQFPPTTPIYGNGGVIGGGGGFGFLPPIGCPQVFSYRINVTGGAYYGHIVIQKPAPVNVFDLAVNMSVNAVVPPGGGIQIVLLTNPHQLLDSRIVEFGVVFPYIQQLPSIVAVVFNNLVYCNVPPPPLVTGAVQTAMFTRRAWQLSTVDNNQYTTPGIYTYYPTTNYPPLTFLPALGPELPKKSEQEGQYENESNRGSSNDKQV